MKRKTTAKNWANQKFYRLTLIKATSAKRRSSILWEALCDCGNITLVIPYEVRSGNTTSCGCFKRELLKQIGSENGKKCRKYNPIISSARVVWSHYKDCSFELFLKLSQQNCFYCGREPHRTWNVGSKKKSGYYNSEYQNINGNFTYNGIDRIDSSKGHSEDNIVPCCWDCNKAKMDLSLSKFINLIELIYHNTRKINSEPILHT